MNNTMYWEFRDKEHKVISTPHLKKPNRNRLEMLLGNFDQRMTVSAAGDKKPSKRFKWREISSIKIKRH